VVKSSFLNLNFSHFTDKDFEDLKYTEVLLSATGVAFSHMKWKLVLRL